MKGNDFPDVVGQFSSPPVVCDGGGAEGMTRRDVLTSVPAVPVAISGVRRALFAVAASVVASAGAAFADRVGAQDGVKQEKPVMADTKPGSPGKTPELKGEKGKNIEETLSLKENREELKWRPTNKWTIHLSMWKDGKQTSEWTLIIERGHGNKGIEATLEGTDRKVELPDIKFPTLYSPENKNYVMTTLVDEIMHAFVPKKSTEQTKILRENGKLRVDAPKVEPVKEAMLKEKWKYEHRVHVHRIFEGRPKKERKADGAEVETPTTVLRRSEGNDYLLPDKCPDLEDKDAVEIAFLRASRPEDRDRETPQRIQMYREAAENGKIFTLVDPEKYYEPLKE